MKLSWRSGRPYDEIRADREEDLRQRISALIDEHHARNLDNYPGYFVTPVGDVYSTLGRRILKLKPGTKPGGYSFVGLKDKNGDRKYEMVHRLVAKAFIPNEMKKPAVNHMNLDKKNNSVENLEWVTNTENSLHAVQAGAIKMIGPGVRILSGEIIRKICLASGTYRQIGERYGCSAQTVCNIKRGHTPHKRPG